MSYRALEKRTGRVKWRSVSGDESALVNIGPRFLEALSILAEEW